MLISAIPPTFPWLITGLSAGPFFSPMASRFNVQPSGLVVWLSVCVRHGCLSKHAKAHFSHDASTCQAWVVICELFICNVFLSLFFDRNKRSDPLCIDNSFTAAVTVCKLAIFLSLGSTMTIRQLFNISCHG